MSMTALRQHRRSEIVEDERTIGNSLIVSFRAGWCREDQGEHVFGEDTVSAALAAVRPCRRADCWL